MQFAKLDDTSYLVRLERGEDLIETVTSFCQTNSIKNATATAIGSIENPTLAHYKVDTKQYSEKKLEGVFELTSLLGNIAVFEDKPLLHFHVTIGDESMQAYAGHLIQTKVSATVEMTITVFPTEYEKNVDEEVGLKLWDLS